MQSHPFFVVESGAFRRPVGCGSRVARVVLSACLTGCLAAGNSLPALAQVTAEVGAAPAADARPAANNKPEAKPAKADADPPAGPTEEIALETSDDVLLTVWHYPAPSSGTLAGLSVILIHDSASSHAGVEPLARALQRAGCDVVAPDLRGHGASRTRRVGDREVKLDAKQLKPADIELIPASRGGKLRDQCLHRGDIETTRNWMISHRIPMERLYVVGVGLGAAMAAAWTAEDAAWPDAVAGPQGKQVRGLVLISPDVAPRGFSLLKPLEQEALKRSIPVLVLGGRGEKDADRIFDHLKRQRPQSWFKKPAKADPERAEKLDDASKATLFQIEIDTATSGEKLAAEKAVSEAVERFFSLTQPTQKPRR